MRLEKAIGNTKKIKQKKRGIERNREKLIGKRNLSKSFKSFMAQSLMKKLDKVGRWE
jgi:hypothetical protein